MIPGDYWIIIILCFKRNANIFYMLSLGNFLFLSMQAGCYIVGSYKISSLSRTCVLRWCTKYRGGKMHALASQARQSSYEFSVTHRSILRANNRVSRSSCIFDIFIHSHTKFENSYIGTTLFCTTTLQSNPGCVWNTINEGWTIRKHGSAAPDEGLPCSVQQSKTCALCCVFDLPPSNRSLHLRPVNAHGVCVRVFVCTNKAFHRYSSILGFVVNVCQMVALAHYIL